MAQRKRNKALDGLATLKASGALSATFHPDGTVASVVFGAPVEHPASAPVQTGNASVVDEVLRRPFKTDLDGIDGLPDYEASEGN